MLRQALIVRVDGVKRGIFRRIVCSMTTPLPSSWWPPSATYPPGEVRIVGDDDSTFAVSSQTLGAQR